MRAFAHKLQRAHPIAKKIGVPIVSSGKNIDGTDAHRFEKR